MVIFRIITLLWLACLFLTTPGRSFQPILQILTPATKQLHHIFSVRYPSCLSLFGGDDDDDDQKESINPNDLETPEERKQRMEMVRKIQKSFYGTDSNTNTTTPQKERTTTIPVAGSSTLLKEVPLWRVQWVELPGYQNLLNCHVAHYTHMFHTILSGPKPWYFGHVYLPGGSENLGNPDYQLINQQQSGSNDEKNKNKTKATYIGVLMQVTDARQLEDGRLALVVQALERFQVIEATQHEPYTLATVQLKPDAELALCHYDDAQALAQELSDDFLNEQDAWGAACAAAWETAQNLQQFEYRPVLVSSSTMGAVSPLANYDAGIVPTQIFPKDASTVDKQNECIHQVMEKHLYSASPMDIPRNLDALDEGKVIQLEHDVWVGVDTLVKLLHQLNPDLNQARVTPVPTQMLGLLPRGSCQSATSKSQKFLPWPADFQLDQYANRLEDYAAVATAGMVGTYSKSPFVRYDFADSNLRRYPILRRARRMSYAVWILLENIGLIADDGDDDDESSDMKPGARPLDRQEILEFPTIAQRLQAAKNRLAVINDALQAMLDT